MVRPNGGWRYRVVRAATAVAVASLIAGIYVTVSGRSQGEGSTDEVPIFQYDPTWPKRLPHSWVFGQIAGLVIDSRDHVWVHHRPGTATGLGDTFALEDPEGGAECCRPAPPMVELDPAGSVVQAWGPVHDAKGTLIGRQSWGPFPDIEWPRTEHGLWLDHKGFVWIGSAGAPSQVLKFTRDGKFVRRFGRKHRETGDDFENFAGPADLWVDPKTNELFVADGEAGRRVIVLDAETGAYKRHWGAYGKPPSDAPVPFPPFQKLAAPDTGQLSNVHCVRGSKDGLLYVCDRMNNRLQVFKTDGTYVSEVFIAPKTRAQGSTFHVTLSQDLQQRFIYANDGDNRKVWILRRSDLKLLGSFGHGGHEGGALSMNHVVAVDSKGNLYVGDAGQGQRVQKFTLKGMRRVNVQ